VLSFERRDTACRGKNLLSPLPKLSKASSPKEGRCLRIPIHSLHQAVPRRVVPISPAPATEVCISFAREMKKHAFGCPDNPISGDKVLARGTRHVVNRAATAVRLGASTLLRSQTYLGAPYRRLRSKLGPKAITAMAHRLARLVYPMLKYGQNYVDKGAEYYEQRHRRQQIEFLRKEGRPTRLTGHTSPCLTYPSRSFWSRIPGSYR
jgi:hypothetical protein